jgi:hypothetical protein
MTNETSPAAPAEITPPGRVDSEDILDWDIFLKDPPARPHGVVNVRVEFLGRDKPLPVLDPDDEVA